VVFIVNMIFEVYTFNMEIPLCRRIYDPGGAHIYLNIYHYTIMLIVLSFTYDGVKAHKRFLSLV
jgi:hypothetical protein